MMVDVPVIELSSGALLPDKELLLLRQAVDKAMLRQFIYGWPRKRAVAEAMKECRAAR